MTGMEKFDTEHTDEPTGADTTADDDVRFAALPTTLLLWPSDSYVTSSGDEGWGPSGWGY